METAVFSLWCDSMVEDQYLAPTARIIANNAIYLFTRIVKTEIAAAHYYYTVIPPFICGMCDMAEVTK